MNNEADFGIGGIHLNLPFPSKISPDVDRARTRNLAWAKEWDLWPDRKIEFVYRQTDFPLFVARAFPFYTGEDLDLVTDLVSWSWLWDDSLDRQSRLPWTEDILAAYLNAMRHPESEPPPQAAIPLVQAWRDLNTRLRLRTSADWRIRHERHWREAFDGFLEEARNNANEVIPEFDTYLDLRRKACGTETVFDWIEAAGWFEAPREIHAAPQMLRLRRDAVDIVAMYNDMFSARNEWSEGNTDNVVIVLAYQEQCSWPEAARMTEELINTTIAHFFATEQELRTSDTYQGLTETGKADTDQFINYIKHWLGGSYTWHTHTPRYKVPATRPIEMPKGLTR